jgi:hypothetical protein
MTQTLTKTVRGKFAANDSFPYKLANWIRERIEIVRESISDGVFLSNQVTTLGELADYISNRSPADSRIYSLWLVAGHLGWNDTEPWQGGPEQVSLLCRAGYGPEAHDPSELLNELVAAAVEDLAEHYGKATQRTDERVADAEREG